MKKHILVIIAAALVFCLLSGCSSGDRTAEEFLTGFYTITDIPALGDELHRAMEEKSDPEFIVEKKEAFRKFFTNDGFEVFLVQPEWANIALNAVIHGKSSEAGEISLEKTESGYSFSLTVTLMDEKTAETSLVLQTGNLIMSGGKISRVAFDNADDLIKAIQPSWEAEFPLGYPNTN